MPLLAVRNLTLEPFSLKFINLNAGESTTYRTAASTATALIPALDAAEAELLIEYSIDFGVNLDDSFEGALLSGALTPLPDSSVTLNVVNGSHYEVLASTFTANRIYTLGTQGTSEGTELSITRFDESAFTLTIANGGLAGGTIQVFPASQQWGMVFRFSTGNWRLKATGRLPWTDAPSYAGNVLSRTLYVDPNTAVPAIDRIGSQLRPFATIQDALNVSAGFPVHIKIQFGNYSAQTLTIGANRDVIIEGPIRRDEGITTIGAINWTTTGLNTSRLGLRNLGVAGTITIIDGTPPATNAVFTAEGCQIGANVGGNAFIQTGTSIVTAMLAGTNATNFTGLTSPVNSILAGDVDINGNIANVLLLGDVQIRSTVNTIACGLLLCHGCSFLDATVINIAGTSSAFFDTIWTGASTITFTGAAGVATLDALTNSSFLAAGGSTTNCVKDGSHTFPAGLVIEPIAATLLPRFNSNSLFTTVVLGSQTDGNYSGNGNGGLCTIARFAAIGPPANAPYTAFAGRDFGAPFAGAINTGRTLYFGGGGLVTPDANNLQFYCAPGPYSEIVDTGELALHVTHLGAGVGTATCVGSSVLNSGGKFQIVDNIGGIAIHQRSAGVDNILAGGLYVNQEFALPGETTGTLSAGNNNNFALSATVSAIRFTVVAATAVLTGLTGGIAGLHVELFNCDATNAFSLAHDDVNSTAANRFFLPGGVPLAIPIHGSVILRYDLISVRWRVAAANLGATSSSGSAIDVLFNQSFS